MELLLIAVVLGGLCGLLAALTGAGAPKSLRRIVVSGITTVWSIVALWNIFALLLMARSAVISEGYGLPDTALTDKGSKVGAFWFNIFAGDHLLANIATRVTIGIQEALVLIVVPIITGCWLAYFFAAVSIIGVYLWFGGIKKNEGTFDLFGKNLLWEEVEIHGINSFIIMMLALLCR